MSVVCVQGAIRCEFFVYETRIMCMYVNIYTWLSENWCGMAKMNIAKILSGYSNLKSYFMYM